MRTAEEIIKSRYPFYQADYQFGDVELDGLSVMELINEARIETIREIAEMAKSEWIRYGVLMGHAVDKQSILKIIDQIK